MNDIEQYGGHDQDDQFEEQAEQIKLPDLEVLKKRFRAAIDATVHGRELSALDRGYFEGNRQVGDGWQKMLKEHNLVSPNINKVKNIVMGQIGVVLQNPVDPQAWPMNPNGQAASDVVTKCLRSATEKAQFEKIKGEVLENFCVEGYAAVAISVGKSKKGTSQIYLDKIHPDEFYWDPSSREYDYRDARYMGVAKWKTIDAIYEEFPDAEQYQEITPGDLLGVDSSTMRDVHNIWINRKDKHVMVVEMYYKDKGEWHHIVFCHCGVLDFGESPYHNDEGETICPIIPVSCFIYQDKRDESLTFQRFGVVRDMIGPQDEYNAHRAAMLKAAISHRIQQIDFTVPQIDPNVVRKEVARPDAIIPPGWQMVPGSDFASQSSLLQLAAGELDRMGPTPAVLGRNLGDEASGRSRMVQQQAGLTESGPMLNRIEDWTETVFATVWYVIKEYWTDQQFVRITGDAKAPQFLEINVPKIEMRMQPMIDPSTGQPAFDPMTHQPIMQNQAVVVGIDNELAKMDMDIRVTSVASNATLEHEVRTQLFDLMARVPLDSPLFMVALELSPIANKTDTIERIKALMAQQAQQSAGADQQKQQLELQQQQLASEQQQAKTQNLQASAQKHAAEAQKTSVEAEQLVHAGAFEDILRQYGFTRGGQS